MRSMWLCVTLLVGLASGRRPYGPAPGLAPVAVGGRSAEEWRAAGGRYHVDRRPRIPAGPHRSHQLAAGPTPADRRSHRAQPPRLGMESVLSAGFRLLEMPQGASRAQTTLSVPQHSGWVSLEIEVYEDGQFLPDVSGI